MAPINLYLHIFIEQIRKTRCTKKPCNRFYTFLGFVQYHDFDIIKKIVQLRAAMSILGIYWFLIVHFSAHGAKFKTTCWLPLPRHPIQWIPSYRQCHLAVLAATIFSGRSRALYVQSLSRSTWASKNSFNNVYDV